MKKLITILVLFVGFLAEAQLPVQRGTKSVAVMDAYLYATFGLKVPVYGDTTAANMMRGNDSLGLMIETITPAAIYFRAVSTGSIHKWTILASTPASPIWGLITGTLSSQLDLQLALNAKQNLISLGTTAQYFRGDLSLATFPTDLSSFANGPGYLTGVNVTNSITGTGSVATPLKLVNDAASPGALKYYGTDNGGVRGWQNTTGDTILVTQIGTGSPQIPLLYAVNGNLRTARLVPGVFTIPAMNADSGVHVDVDTTGPGGAAYKQWVINLISSGFNSLQQVISNNDTLRKDDTIELNQHNLLYHSTGAYNELDIQMINGSSQTELQTTPTVMSWGVTDGTTLNTVNIQAGQHSFSSSQGSKFNQLIIAPDSVSLAATNGTTVKLSMTPTTGRLTGLSQANDTTAYKPMAVGTDGILKRMDGWAGSGGGGAADVVQTYTSGSTLTQSASTNYIQVNPASNQSTLTITTLGSGGTWHTSNDLYIVAGGTMTSGTVISTLTITAGSGLTLIQAVTPAMITAGEVIRYHKIGSFLYRIN